MNVLQPKYMSIPTGHFINRRFFRSKSAQPKGRWFPSRRSSRCLRFGCTSMAAKYARDFIPRIVLRMR